MTLTPYSEAQTLRLGDEPEEEEDDDPFTSRLMTFDVSNLRLMTFDVSNLDI